MKNYLSYIIKNNLNEDWEKTITINGKVYEIFINPSTNELSQIESFNDVKELRGILFSEYVYIFDSNALHKDIKKKITTSEHGCNIFINIKTKQIHVHNGDNCIKIFNNNYLNNYFNGFEVYYKGSLKGKI